LTPAQINPLDQVQVTLQLSISLPNLVLMIFSQPTLDGAELKKYVHWGPNLLSVVLPLSPGLHGITFQKNGILLAICYDALLPTTCKEKTHISFKDPVG
jgi:hypothetical protein